MKEEAGFKAITKYIAYMDWKASHIFQEIGIFESKYRQVSWKALFSFQIGNSALSYIKIQLNQCFSESLFKLASLRHKIPLKSHHFTGSSQS